MLLPVCAALGACAPGFDMVRVPGLYPTFQFAVTDYVNRCDPTRPTDVRVQAPDGTEVSVDGAAARSGTFTVQVGQQVNERFEIEVFRAGRSSTHHVRCLPADFPDWSSARSGTPQAQYYATVINDDGALNQPVVFDTNGVPVWWTERQAASLLTPLANGDLATVNTLAGMVERRLDGTVVRTVHVDGGLTDLHDAILLPNGNYALASFEVHPCDLTPWGEGPASCAFHRLQELAPDGTVVWSWRPETDIPLRETTPTWRTVRNASGVADPWHWNSVEWTGDGFIVSFRHLDAIYKIDYGTKDVVWKLGGSSTPQRLDVIGDPVFSGGGSFSGQHDARLLGDGEADVYDVSLFDNGTRAGRRPRSVIYRIDERAGTATFVRQVTDAIAPTSGCCGSTRILGGGNHVTGWGNTPWITENRPDGAQVFRVDATSVYRGVPIEPGWATPEQLRAGMDAQYDDGVFVGG